MKKLVVAVTILVAVAFAFRKTGIEEHAAKTEKKTAASVAPAPLPLPSIAAEPPKKEPPPVVVAKPPPDPMIALFEKMLKALEKADAEQLREISAEMLKLFIPKSIAPEKNGALVFLAGFEKMSRFTDEEREAMEAIREGTATAVQAALIEGLVARNAEALEIFRKAGEYDEFQFPIVYEEGFNAQLPHIGPLRNAASLAEFEGIFRKAKGEADAESQALIGRMAAALAEEPLIVSQLLRDRLIEQTGIGENASVRPIWRNTMMMDFAASVAFGLSQIDESMLALPEIQAMGRHYMATMREGTELIMMPWLESHDRLEALANSIRSGGMEAEGTRQLAPEFARVADLIARAEAAMGAAVDPFTGKAMLSRNGLTYSVGPDGVDNGGDPKLDVVVRPR